MTDTTTDNTTTPPDGPSITDQLGQRCPSPPPPLDDAITVAISDLEKIAANGTREDRPDRLPVDEIQLCPEAFNVRGDKLAEHHLTDLKRALERMSDLDPVLVLPCGETFVLVDGHHRLEAYRRDQKRDDIPVRYFEASIDEAVLEAARVNSKAVLPLCNEQRQNLAWRLVRTRRFSKKQVTECAAVSDGQTANMRRALKRLGAEASEYDTWWEAQQAAAGRQTGDDDDFDPEIKLREQAAAYADRMAKAFSNKLSRNPTLHALVLDHYCGRNLKELYRELGMLIEIDPNEDDEDEEF